jgi:class 3 adenylate cyclase/tetratricopeptide (TPR) repeat protein
VICSNCGSDNQAGARFCNECGSAMQAGCPSCGAVNRPGARFCNECGQALASGARPSAPVRDAGATARAPGQERVTERRMVSVLFADLVGFTALSDDRDPEAVREFLDSYFRLARERIERYGGIIEKFIGDAVMAVWGTPVAHEDDAERAVRAAVDLLDAVGGLRTPDGSTIAARCAVMTGEAAVTLGADGQGMVAGDLVNTASRLQSVAPPGSVLAGEATVRASESAIAYEPVGDQMVRGKQLPVPAWRAARIVAGRGGYGRSARLEAPFVGRDDELRLLKEMLHATARDGRARLVSVLGIPGIGKSRLAWELEKYIDGLVEDIYWHQGRSPAYGEGLAFWALGEMVRGRARIAESDPPDVARAKLAEMAAEYLRDPAERARVEPPLATLLGLGGPTSGSTEELTAAWRTLFERIADRGPTVLVFEDLHWADPGLLDFIEGLLASARNRPIMVLALAHPELIDQRPTFGATVRNHTRLDLSPLTDDAMDTLLLGLVPGIPQAALRVIRERAAGIPLYAVETVRMLLDQGRLSESGGRYRLDSDLDELAVPDSLQSLIGARLDTLDERSRQLVGIASVLGLSFSVSALMATAELPEADVRGVLDTLVEREVMLFEDDSTSPERGQYRFIQGVLREVAYGRLARRDRVLLHLAAAAYFDQAGNDELAGVVASHYLSAIRSAPDDADKPALAARTVAALEAAAGRSSAIGAHAGAAGYLADAVALSTDEETQLRLLEARADALQAASRYADAAAVARTVLDAAFRRGELDRAARLGTVLVGAIISGGRPADAVTEAEAIRGRLGPDVDRDPDAIRLTAELARAHLMNGSHAEAGELIDAILPVADRLGLREVMAELLPSLGWALAAEGRAIQAVALLRGSLVFAEGEGLFNAEMRSRMNLSANAADERPAEALEVAWSGARRARERGYSGWAIAAGGNACSVAFGMGEWDRVEAMAAELEVLNVLGDWANAWDFAMAAEVCRVRGFRGRISEARELLDRFDRRFPDVVDPQVRLALLLTRSHLAFAEGDLEAVTRPSREADRLVLALGSEGDRLVEAVATIEMGDVVRLAEIITALEVSRVGGRVGRAGHEALAGALRVLRGDVAGLSIVDEASRVFRTHGMRFSLALVLRARAMLAPSAEGAAAAAEEARAILTQLGAVTLLRGLPVDTAAPAAATDALERMTS